MTDTDDAASARCREKILEALAAADEAGLGVVAAHLAQAASLIPDPKPTPD